MTGTKLDFSRDKPAGKEVLAWWRDLQERPGDRAELRRCREPSQAVFLQAYHRLLRAMEKEHMIHPDRLASVAIILSHVRQDVPGKALGELMGKPSQDKSSAPISDLRFKRFLRIPDGDSLIEPMQRLLAQLGDSAPVDRVAEVAYWWNESTKKRLAFDYYRVAPNLKK